jgi:beta-galactosidase
VVDQEGRTVPTAGNRIRFDVEGPARLIGVGNGDPGSHEADKPAERDRYAAPVNWRHHGAERQQDLAALLADTGTAGWDDPFAWTPPDGPQPVVRPWNIVRAAFARPATAVGDHAVLLVGDVATGQQVFVNGRPVTSRPQDGMGLVELDPSLLKETNTLAIAFATPPSGVRKVLDEALDGKRWATLRVTTPAPEWQRSLFNGHAQVLVQSTGESGHAVLRARGEGLDGADLSIELF